MNFSSLFKKAFTLVFFGALSFYSFAQTNANKTNLYTVNGIDFETVTVTSGSFNMGGMENSDQMPVHPVHLDAFEMGQMEVTQELFLSITGTNGSYNRGDAYPVENVSWYDAVVYCNKLSLLLDLTPCYYVNGMADPSYWNYSVFSGNAFTGKITCNFSADGFRLPTEAEWEYAARGGAQGSAREYIYSGSNDLDYVAINSSFAEATMEGGFMDPNQLGIYDMSGNVFEWCWDWFGYYSDCDEAPYTGPDAGVLKILRGGSYSSSAIACLNESRYGLKPLSRHNDVGFRVVRHILTEEEKREIARNQKAQKEAELMADMDESYRSLSSRRFLFGSTYNLFVNSYSFTPSPDLTLGYTVNGFLYSPVTDHTFVGFAGGMGLNNMTKDHCLTAVVRYGANSPLLADRMLRFSCFVQAGMIDFELGAGAGVEIEIMSLFTRNNFGIGMIISGDASITQSLKLQGSGGLGIELLLPNIRIK